MEIAIREIVGALKAGEPVDEVWLDKLVRRRSREMRDGTRRVAKKRLLPFYLNAKRDDPELWESWGVDADCEEALVRLLRAKPRRTASGVATITVLTKPRPCSSDCVYCPNDVRMPKSYLTDEPACQRAERNFFDPYLQVTSRLRVLESMGHVTDKVELIVLGGTWSDYSESYQLWFASELFRALNDAGVGCDWDSCRDERDPVGTGPCPVRSGGTAFGTRETSREREAFYRSCGLTYDRDELARSAAPLQQAVNAGERSYNDAVCELYGSAAWERASRMQHATFADLEREHAANEGAAHRAVGFVVETRPDLVTPASLAALRRLGCTKIQMGIQSLDEAVLARCERRGSSPQTVARALGLARLFGFKTHVHFMVNLPGATPAGDKADYRHLVGDAAYLPDEVKLYPCCLVESSRLMESHARGEWVPYGEEELVDVLMADVEATPAYTRISRMIRDISSGDIVAGNKKTNLRQMVEDGLRKRGVEVREIRSREISTAEVQRGSLTLETLRYATAVSEERFLQWTTSDRRIAGFLRLSLPHAEALQWANEVAMGEDEGRGASDERHGDGGLSFLGKRQTPVPMSFGWLLPVRVGEGMIREVHVYGKVARLHAEGVGVQHAGLGRELVEEACVQARAAGCSAVSVISSVGTRRYYRALGFEDAGLYQRRAL